MNNRLVAAVMLVAGPSLWISGPQAAEITSTASTVESDTAAAALDNLYPVDDITEIIINRNPDGDRFTEARQINIIPDNTFNIDPGPIIRSGAALDMGQVVLTTAGTQNGTPGGEPIDPAIGAVGTGGNYNYGNSSIRGGNPQIQNTASFDLVANGLGPTNVVPAGPGVRQSSVRHIPEPMSLVLLGTGLIGFAFIRRKRA
jgi:PEP-CTERM motif